MSLHVDIQKDAEEYAEQAIRNFHRDLEKRVEEILIQYKFLLYSIIKFNSFDFSFSKIDKVYKSERKNS